jgi:hypothetical protein
VLYGYRVHEVITTKLPPVDHSFKIIKWKQATLGPSRPIMRVSLGIHQINYANPVPDTTNQENALNGVMKRIATKMPDIEPELHQEFRQFSAMFMKEKMACCIILPHEDYSFETWIATAPYPGVRRDELKKIYEASPELVERDFILKCFIKDESYTEFKYPRGIYSRSDRFKCKYGPLMKLVGDKMFAMDYFIKKIPVSDRAKHIQELYSDLKLKFATNDFTAFESTFTTENMDIELEFLEFCFQFLPNRIDIMDDLRKIKKGMNKMQFRSFVVGLIAKRYSGEMDTSLCNSLFNLMIVMFILYKSGEPWQHLVPKIEGDDSIIPYYGKLDITIAKRLGANAKFEFFQEISHASFCGLVFDVDCLDIVTPIIPAFLDFGWTTREYRHSNKMTKLTLLRCKALSMLHTYPGCPILHSLACMAIRITKSINMVNNKTIKHYIKNHVDSHHYNKFHTILEYETTEKDKLVTMINRKINFKTRLLVEKLQGISVEQQLNMEEYLDNIHMLQPLNLPYIDDFCNRDQQRMWDMYSSYVSTEGL